MKETEDDVQPSERIRQMRSLPSALPSEGTREPVCGHCGRDLQTLTLSPASQVAVRHNLPQED